MDFETAVGEKIIALIKYWQEIDVIPEQRIYQITKKKPEFSNATRVEKAALVNIKRELSADQWSNVNIIFKDAVIYNVQKNAKRIEEYNLIIKRKQQQRDKEKREREELEKKIIAERENEAKRIKEKRERECRRVIKENEKRSLEFAKQIEEDRIRLEEKNRKIQEILKIIESDFLTDRTNIYKKYSTWISREELNNLSTNYIQNWFVKQNWANPDIEQAQCIAEVWDNVQVIARAGSGKTSTIVNRAAFLVKHCGVPPSKMLLLAFNRDAAKEISERLREKIGKEIPQAMTFHALSYGLVHPEESLIFDDESNGYSKSLTVQQIIDAFLQNSEWSKKIENLMIKYFRSSWNDYKEGGYNLSSDEMVGYRRSLPFVGLDGKYYKSHGEKKLADYLFEHGVPYRYEKNFWWEGKNYRPDFTIPLLNDFKGIVVEYYGVTNDSEYNNQIQEKRIFWTKQQDYRFIELLPEDIDSWEILDKILGAQLISNGFNMRRLSDSAIWHRIKDRAVDEFSQTISQFIGRCRKSMITPEDLANKINNYTSVSMMQLEFLRIAWKIYLEYLKILSKNNEEDFDGLLIKAEHIVNHGYSCWKRKSGSGDLKNVCYLFIDEYQDFSMLFYRLILAIRNLNEDLKVFCVGDDWQAINGFAGSDLRYFNNFMEYYDHGKILSISSNYRSNKKIIDAGNELMSGLGKPSRPVNNTYGDVQVVHIDEFRPNLLEEELYFGDIITPMIIRLVYLFIKKGQRVALLCRRRNGLPWYTHFESSKVKFLDILLSKIRDALPEELRSMVVSVSTVHSYKGKEEDAIIVVDAVARSYPLIHPNNVFFEVLGYTIEDVIAEEHRLFYVAMSRAKQDLIFITESGNKSEFLKKILRNVKKMHASTLNNLPSPLKDGSHYMISIQSINSKVNGTFEIKSYLKERGYRWNPSFKSWIKHSSVEEFSKKKILDEAYAMSSSEISINVYDEFDQKILKINIVDGVVLTSFDITQSTNL